ncbi:UNKNOWN [Stylonychia lemnae]|uniref:Uncharacterized protein n=1 Tax=Stylonychia lemnae TaxID=5949 RepID=A0A078A475_STYLE|nr:UNKNOWN [Stylonychia lemnae]|eukprot:CDW76952.1 UNKNOWN [Stylonychia lemnae]
MDQLVFKKGNGSHSVQECMKKLDVNGSQISISDKYLTDLITYLESENGCSGICNQGLFFYQNDINNGPPSRSCLNEFQQVVYESFDLMGGILLALFVLKTISFFLQQCLMKQTLVSTGQNNQIMTSSSPPIFRIPPSEQIKNNESGKIQDDSEITFSPEQDVNGSREQQHLLDNKNLNNQIYNSPSHPLNQILPNDVQKFEVQEQFNDNEEKKEEVKRQYSSNKTFANSLKIRDSGFLPLMNNKKKIIQFDNFKLFDRALEDYESSKSNQKEEINSNNDYKIELNLVKPDNISLQNSFNSRGGRIYQADDQFPPLQVKLVQNLSDGQNENEW